MPSLAPEEYQYLAAMAEAYRDIYLPTMKNSRYRNPGLGVDALCFERLDTTFDGVPLMAGALITPCELWLVAIPDLAALRAPLPEELLLELPSGRYLLTLERLPGGYDIYMRSILTDLSELEGMQEAARLAQQMMLRLMSYG